MMGEVAIILVPRDPFPELDRVTQQVLGTAPGARGDDCVVEFDLPGIGTAMPPRRRPLGLGTTAAVGIVGR